MTDAPTRPVAFHSSPGHRLAGLLYEPPERAHGGGVVLAQGFGGFKEGTPPELAKLLARRGYAVLTIDYRGFGESEGPRGRLDPFGQVQDLRDAITWLALQDGVDAERISLYGTSFGGALVTYTAAVDTRVRAVVATVPVTHGERWLRSLRRHWEFEKFLDEITEDRRLRLETGSSRLVEKYHIMVPDPGTTAYYEEVVRKDPGLAHAQITLESVERIMEFRPVDVAHLIAPRPLLVIAAERDVLVPPSQAIELHERAHEPKRLVTIPDMNHFTVYREGVREQVMDMAADWFDTHAPASTEAVA